MNPIEGHDSAIQNDFLNVVVVLVDDVVIVYVCVCMCVYLCKCFCLKTGLV